MLRLIELLLAPKMLQVRPDFKLQIVGYTLCLHEAIYCSQFLLLLFPLRCKLLDYGSYGIYTVWQLYTGSKNEDYRDDLFSRILGSDVSISDREHRYCRVI